MSQNKSEDTHTQTNTECLIQSIFSTDNIIKPLSDGQQVADGQRLLAKLFTILKVLYLVR